MSQLAELVSKIADVGENAFVRLYGDGSGILCTDFNQRDYETEIAFRDTDHLLQILDQWKPKMSTQNYEDPIPATENMRDDSTARMLFGNGNPGIFNGMTDSEETPHLSPTEVVCSVDDPLTETVAEQQAADEDF